MYEKILQCMKCKKSDKKCMRRYKKSGKWCCKKCCHVVEVYHDYGASGDRVDSG